MNRKNNIIDNLTPDFKKPVIGRHIDDNLNDANGYMGDRDQPAFENRNRQEDTNFLMAQEYQDFQEFLMDE